MMVVIQKWSLAHVRLYLLSKSAIFDGTKLHSTITCSSNFFSLGSFKSSSRGWFDEHSQRSDSDMLTIEQFLSFKLQNTKFNRDMLRDN
jgi:hypothetical protein